VSRLAPLLTVVAALTTLVAACSPEVVIARSEQTSGGTAAGTEGTAGSSAGGSGASGSSAGGSGAGGSGAGGSGVPPLGDAGESGQGGADATEPPRLLADSVADFSTVVQGDHGWTYGYDSGSLETFTPMTSKAVIINYVPVSMDHWDCWVSDTTKWTQLFRLGGHPNGTITGAPSPKVLQRAVRRWTSSRFTGDITISGEAAKIDLVGSNGVDVSVYVDAVQVYTTFIAGDDGGGTSYQVPATPIHIGSTVDFVIDPHESDDRHDLTRFTGIIVAQPP
jgi:hypothetical protein